MGKKAAALTLVIALLVAVGIGTVGCSTAEGKGKVKWLNDWTEALSRAQDQNKPMVIYFYTDMCPACLRLEQNAFSDDELSAFLNKNFICLESNAGRSTLHARYGIDGTVPTTVFSASDGYQKKYELARIVGAAPADHFYQVALAALEGVQE